MVAQETEDGMSADRKHVLLMTESASEMIARCLKYDLMPALARIYTTDTHRVRPIVLLELANWQPGSQMEPAIQRLASYECGTRHSSWKDFETLKSLADVLGSARVQISLRVFLGRQVRGGKIPKGDSKVIRKTISSALSIIMEMVPLWSTPGRSVQIFHDNANSKSNASNAFSRSPDSCTVATTDNSRVPRSLIDKTQGPCEVTTLAPSSDSGIGRGLAIAELCCTDDERFVLDVY